MEQKNLVKITDSLENHLSKLIEQKISEGMNDPHFLLDPVSGGCNGFQYHMDIVDPSSIEGEYSVYKKGSVKIAISELGQLYLAGCEIDYDEFKGIQIKNPNAKSSCGCGNSFGI